MSEEKLQAHKLFLDLLSSLSLPLTCHCLSYSECQQQGQKFVPPFMASPTVVNNTCQEPIGAQFFLTFQEFCTLRQSGNSVTDPWQPDGSERSFSGFIHGVQDPFIIFHYPKSNPCLKTKRFHISTTDCAFPVETRLLADALCVSSCQETTVFWRRIKQWWNMSRSAKQWEALVLHVLETTVTSWNCFLSQETTKKWSKTFQTSRNKQLHLLILALSTLVALDNNQHASHVSNDWRIGKMLWACWSHSHLRSSQSVGSPSLWSDFCFSGLLKQR